MSKSNVLVTGATGFVGRHWVYRLLTAEPGARVTALVRGESLEQARERLEQALWSVRADHERALQSESLQRLDVVLGDVEQAACGVSRDACDALRGRIDQVWHLAASTDFRPEHARLVEQRNVGGTANALALGGEIGAADFFHVSTAYVCGRTQGDIAETLRLPMAGFNNHYEASKYASERLVLGESGKAGMRGHVLRPSIIMAPKSTFAARGARHGLYGFLHGAYAMKAALGGEQTLRVHGESEARLNLIAVDDVVADMLSAHRRPELAGDVSHLVSDVDLTASEVITEVCRAAGILPFRIENAPLVAPSPLEQALQHQVAVYSAYLSGVRRFERRAPERHGFGVQELRRCCENWVAEREQRKRAGGVERAQSSGSSLPSEV